MGKSAPKPPPAPDPTVVSNAQSAANIATAQAQQKLNMINTYGPNGSVVYGADPNAPGGYSQTTQLSPDQQKINDLGNSANIGALGLANDQVGRIGTALGTPLNTDGLAPLAGSIPGAGQGIQSTFDKGGPLQYSFNQGQQVQGQVGGDLNQARQQAQDAAYSQATARLDPRFNTAESQMQTRLANQGLSMNSDAYKNAADTFGRERTDAYGQAQNQAVQQGNAAADQLFQQQLGQGQFANQAAAQMYGQNMGAAQFNNQTAGQDFSQNMGAAGFANTAQQQQFQQNAANAQFGNESRNQGLQERAYLQNQPISQFSALMGGQQVQGPEGIQYSPSAVGQTDVTGAYALQQQAQQANYQAQMQNRSSGLSGLMSLGMAGLMAPMTGGGSLAGAMGSKLLASDIRVKEDIRRVGQLDNGLGVYSFRYKSGGPVQIGVMAQEVAGVRPDAVHDVGGVLHVDYGAL